MDSIYTQTPSLLHPVISNLSYPSNPRDLQESITNILIIIDPLETAMKNWYADHQHLLNPFLKKVHLEDIKHIFETADELVRELKFVMIWRDC